MLFWAECAPRRLPLGVLLGVLSWVRTFDTLVLADYSIFLVPTTIYLEHMGKLLFCLRFESGFDRVLLRDPTPPHVRSSFPNTAPCLLCI